MADKHPYLSGSAGLISAVTQLRKAFPQQITAETLKKLGIAPNNESLVINTLRFIDIIDVDGRKTDIAADIFSQHDDQEFQRKLAVVVEKAYAGLFELHAATSWNLPSDKLISFFRSTDQTSAIVGQRQASTFQALAGLSGHLDTAASKPSVVGRPNTLRVPKYKKLEKHESIAPKEEVEPPTRDVGLTVRIEINLPVAPDQDTYDRIFRSIRANLLNG